MTMASQDALPCLLCDRALPTDAARRCLTDCAHEFCLSCLCGQLAARKNRCPACGAPVKLVHQLQPVATSASAPPPASVRFCNATYVLNVSIWDVHDPARVLAGLFNLCVACATRHLARDRSLILMLMPAIMPCTESTRG
jgi:hypothetical protein